MIIPSPKFNNIYLLTHRRNEMQISLRQIVPPEDQEAYVKDVKLLSVRDRAVNKGLIILSA